MRDKKNLRESRATFSIREDRLLLSVHDVSKILRVTPYWVRRQVNAGRFIPSLLLAPKVRRFRAVDVEAYIAKRIAAANTPDVPAVEGAATQEKT
jgi:hypothetical protein